MFDLARHGSGFAFQLARGVLPLPPRPATDAGLLMAQHARTFDFAARFLPPDRRDAARVLYAFYRTLDDLVDEPDSGLEPAVVRAELDEWRRWLQGDRQEPGPRPLLARELARVIDDFRIPARYFMELVEGLTEDLDPREIRDATELRHYCYQVAGTVGLTMSHVLGATSPHALLAAEELGIAMQLTNILRDVGEDLVSGRIYLPRIELAYFGTSRGHLLALRERRRGLDDPARELMRFQVARAHAHYRRGIAGIWLLPPDCRLPILIATRLYRRILDEIERRNYDTLSQRAATSRWIKTREAAIAFALDSLWRSGEPPVLKETLDVVVH